MKLILACLLAIGLVAAGAPFPGTLQSSGLVLVANESFGDIGNGSAYYSNADKTAEIFVNAQPAPAEDWQGLSEEYETSAGKGATAGGAQYYYYCSLRQGQHDCTFETYLEGIHYQMDVKSLGDSEETAVQYGQLALDDLFSKTPGGKLCPLGLIMLLIPFAAFLRKQN